MKDDKDLKFGENAEEDFMDSMMDSSIEPPIPELPTLWKWIKNKFGKETLEIEDEPEEAFDVQDKIKEVKEMKDHHTHTSTSEHNMHTTTVDHKPASPLSSPFSSPATVINRDTVVEGPIKSKSDVKINGIVRGHLNCEGNITVGGQVYGDISGEGNVTISGQAYGDITGRDIHINGGIIKGNITASGNVTFDGKAVIIGNISGNDCTIDGKVKGQISANGSVTLQNNALVHGNISAKNFSAQNGAVINGHVIIVCDTKQSESEIFALPDVPKEEAPKTAEETPVTKKSDSTTTNPQQ